MFNQKLFYLLLSTSLCLSANTIDLLDEAEQTGIKNDSIKFSFEVGTQKDFWSPGLSGNVLEYQTEGLFLGYGQFKLKLYDNDVLTLEKYNTFSSSNTQSELLEYYKENQKNNASIDGIHLSVHFAKILNYLFDKKWINGFNYEFKQKNFLGDANLKMNAIYWYGKLNGGIINQDFSLLEKGDRLSFKTEFRSHRLSYQWNHIFKNIEGSTLCLGAFDKEWSKPTFVGYTSLQGKLPVIFDAHYYAKGVGGSVGIEKENYNIKAYLDVGIDNKINVINYNNQSKALNDDVDIYTMGITANYHFVDVYSSDNFNTNIIIGTDIEYNKIVQNGFIALDAEQLYGVHAGVEIIF